MTGRDLIIYILENDLEDEEIFKDGKPIGFLTEDEVAIELEVGLATVKTMISLGVLEGITIGNKIYIRGDYKTKINGES